MHVISMKCLWPPTLASVRGAEAHLPGAETRAPRGCIARIQALDALIPGSSPCALHARQLDGRARLRAMPFDPNASFGKSLFFGEILEDQIFPYPEVPREQVELVAPIAETIDKYMAGIDSRKLDRSGEMPAELLQSLREMGL